MSVPAADLKEFVGSKWYLIRKHLIWQTISIYVQGSESIIKDKREFRKKLLGIAYRERWFLTVLRGVLYRVPSEVASYVQDFNEPLTGKYASLEVSLNWEEIARVMDEVNLHEVVYGFMVFLASAILREF